MSKLNKKTDKKRQTRKVGVAGGFVNQLMGNNSTEPKVGEGATILSYSDRSAYEVLEVSKDGLQCKIRAMKCNFVGQCYGDEKYTYDSNESNSVGILEWNAKKNCWGTVHTSIEIQKSLMNKLFNEHGYKWRDFLPVPYETLIAEDSDEYYHTYKLVKGVTKAYRKFNKVSVIFGVMEQYRDPSF